MKQTREGMPSCDHLRDTSQGALLNTEPNNSINTEPNMARAPSRSDQINHNTPAQSCSVRLRSIKQAVRNQLQASRNQFYFCHLAESFTSRKSMQEIASKKIMYKHFSTIAHLIQSWNLQLQTRRSVRTN